MFWDKAYTPSQNIEAILQKEDVTLEELLDDEDILQECKTQKRTLVQYLTRPDVIKRLIELIITEPPENLSVAQRFKHSNTACEILTFGLPSLDEKLVEEPTILQTLYSFLKQEPPLNPLLSSFFSKTFSMLISKKSEQDWFLYQRMCLQVLEFIKSQNDFLDLIFKHFATPVIMDLLLQIIKEVQGGALKKDLFEWLTEQKLVERLIKMLGEQNELEKHNNISEFLCELIRHGRSMRQNEQENDSFEPTFIGSNPLLQVLEDKYTISLLLDVILNQPPKESSITSGIFIILTLVDESIVDEPASDKALQMIIDREKENHEKIVSTVIQAISPRLKDFHELLLNPPEKNDIITTVAQLSPPFGLTRLQICRLFTVLLRTGNENIINAICETDIFDTLLKLFKQYIWNNFLHSEVEKCFRYVFTTFDQNENEKSFEISPSALQTHVIVNCKIIPKLIDCWMRNKEVQSTNNGRRLGYMGHLIQIFENISLCITKSDHIGALIVSNLTEKELEDWKYIMNLPDGELLKDLQIQTRFLADCDPYQSANTYEAPLPKDFQNESFAAEFYHDFTSNLPDNLDEQTAPGNESALEKLCEYLGSENVINCLLAPSDDIALNLQRQLKVWGSNSDDILGEDNMDFDPFSEASKPETSPFSVTINPWGADTFTHIEGGDSSSSGWADFSSNNFADFDSHFNTFASDLGEKVETTNQTDTNIITGKSDNNANIKTIFTDKSDEDEINVKNAKNLNIITNNQNDEINVCSESQSNLTDTKCISIGDNNIVDDVRQENVQNTLKTDSVDDRVSVTNGPNNEASSGDNIIQNENIACESSTNLGACSMEAETKLENKNDITDKDMENVTSVITTTTVLENGPV